MPIRTNRNLHVLPNEIRIDNLEESDIGDYMCVAKNRQGSITATTKVVVAGPAIISTPPINTTSLEGNKVELTCEAKASPSNVTYRWFHKGIEISQLSWLITRTSLKRNGTLVINPTSSEDSGKFTCDAFNGIGEPDTASAYLNIECEFQSFPSFTISKSVSFVIFKLLQCLECQIPRVSLIHHQYNTCRLE
jgi:hypothetical protein